MSELYIGDEFSSFITAAKLMDWSIDIERVHLTEGIFHNYDITKGETRIEIWFLFKYHKLASMEFDVFRQREIKFEDSDKISWKTGEDKQPCLQNMMTYL